MHIRNTDSRHGDIAGVLDRVAIGDDIADLHIGRIASCLRQSQHWISGFNCNHRIICNRRVSAAGRGRIGRRDICNVRSGVYVCLRDGICRREGLAISGR